MAICYHATLDNAGPVSVAMTPIRDDLTRTLTGRWESEDTRFAVETAGWLGGREATKPSGHYPKYSAPSVMFEMNGLTGDISPFAVRLCIFTSEIARATDHKETFT